MGDINASGSKNVNVVKQLENKFLKSSKQNYETISAPEKENLMNKIHKTENHNIGQVYTI